MRWEEQFKIIEQIIAEELARSRKKFTLANAAGFVGIKTNKWLSWSKGQRPNADDLENLCRLLGLNPEWLLLGSGLPTRNETSGKYIKEYVEIGDTLHDLIPTIPASFVEIAQMGGIGTHELTSCMNSWELPSCLTVARWVHAYRINANFLIAQVGMPFLTEEEYRQRGPADWHRERRGDFDDKDFEVEQKTIDPITQRILTLERVLRDAGASDEDIIQAVKAAVRADTSPARDLACDAAETDPVVKNLDADPYNDQGAE